MQYTKEQLRNFSREEIINTVLKLQQEVVDIEEMLQYKDNLYNQLKEAKYKFEALAHNSVSNEEYAVVKALRNLMVEHIDIAVEHHEEICHTETIKGC